MVPGAFVRVMFPTREKPRQPGLLHIGYVLGGTPTEVMVAYTTSRPWPAATPLPAGASWNIDIVFADKTPPIHFVTGGERIKIPPIDAQAVSDTNKPPTLTAQQAAMWTWTPDPATWATIQAHSVAAPATLVIGGMRDGRTVLSQSRVAFTTSADPVGAPIFYRDLYRQLRRTFRLSAVHR